MLYHPHLKETNPTTGPEPLLAIKDAIQQQWGQLPPEHQTPMALVSVRGFVLVRSGKKHGH
jgi:hypothetical protein